MENPEIIFVCNSVNNKNVRANELKILEKHPEELYFIFGESNENAKKRYYKDLKTLDKDFAALKKIKEDLENNNLEEIKIVSEDKPTLKSKSILEDDFQEEKVVKRSKRKLED